MWIIYTNTSCVFVYKHYCNHVPNNRISFAYVNWRTTQCYWRIWEKQISETIYCHLLLEDYFRLIKPELFNNVQSANFLSGFGNYVLCYDTPASSDGLEDLCSKISLWECHFPDYWTLVNIGLLVCGESKSRHKKLD